MPTDTLFEPGPAPARAQPPASGLLVTNHLNLMYMLAAGLVMPPAKFGDKYYRDTLGSFPGWIPLFIGRVPAAAIYSSAREAGHLRPAVLEIGLAGLSGRVLALGPELRELRFPDQLDGNERLLLVPAPLPSSRIAAAVFRSQEDRLACEADAKDFGNVPLRNVRRRVAKTLFTRTADDPWPVAGGPPAREVRWMAPWPPAASWPCCSPATGASWRSAVAGTPSIRRTRQPRRSPIRSCRGFAGGCGRAIPRGCGRVRPPGSAARAQEAIPRIQPTCRALVRILGSSQYSPVPFSRSSSVCERCGNRLTRQL